MDYKELIEQLCDCVKFDEDLLVSAADAIETLLAEREAAVRDLTEVCEDNPDVCHFCKHVPCTESHGRCIGWQWRGPTPPDRLQKV